MKHKKAMSEGEHMMPGHHEDMPKKPMNPRKGHKKAKGKRK